MLQQFPKCQSRAEQCVEHFAQRFNFRFYEFGYEKTGEGVDGRHFAFDCPKNPRRFAHQLAENNEAQRESGFRGKFSPSDPPPAKADHKHDGVTEQK